MSVVGVGKEEARRKMIANRREQRRKKELEALAWQRIYFAFFGLSGVMVGLVLHRVWG